MNTQSNLIIELKRQGISQAQILDVMTKLPRENFLPAIYHNRAFDNIALPIDCQQTISQPYIVALMTKQLFLCPHPKRIIEIGTGSGYQAAVLSQLFDEIFTVERIPTLLAKAQKILQELDIQNIK